MARNGGNKLDRRQELAIAALLGCKDVPIAAQQAGGSLRTLHRWLAQDVSFKAAYREARRQVVSQAVAQIQQACGLAVETLCQGMAEPASPAASRVSAAKTVFEMAVRGIELEDIGARLTALEQAAEERQRLDETLHQGRAS